MAAAELTKTTGQARWHVPGVVLPELQEMQLVEPAVEYLPALHSAHLEAVPVRLLVPPAQSAQHTDPSRISWPYPT